MILDAQNLFSDEQTMAGTITPAASTNVIDLGSERYLGTGEPLDIVLQVVEALSDAGSNSTIAVTIQTDTDEAFGSPTVYATVPGYTNLLTFGPATPVDGTAALPSKVIFRLVPDRPIERYMRLVYTIAGGDLSTGKITAGFVKDAPAFRAYNDAVTIS